MDIKLLQGRLFDQEKESDSLAYFILNETAVRNLNIEKTLQKRMGQYINQNGDLQFGNIIGAVKDIHIEGFNQEIRPMIMTISNQTWYASIKIANEDMASTIDFIEK